MAYGGQTASTTAIELPVAENISNKISGIAEQVGGLKSRLNELRIRALGNGGSKLEAAATPRPVPSGKFDGIQVALEDLSKSVEECHQVAAQLERIA